MGSVEEFYKATGPGQTGFDTVIGLGDNSVPFLLGVFGEGQVFGVAGVTVGAGPLQQNSYSRRAGVVGGSFDFTGAAGVSLNRVGVFGQVENRPRVPDGLRAGVLGVASTQPGVIGFSRDGDGIEGASFAGTAVRATSFFGAGVHSVSGTLSGVTGISGTPGPTVPGATAGVVGSSSERHGVIGTSNAAAGLVGFSNNVGIFALSTNPNSFAGLFVGDVLINGTLTASVKNGVVTFPDRTQRVLHCMESPEHWFEDFGVARLKRGRAVVKLDTEFALVIKRGDYHVFLTPEGDCRGLYLRSKQAAGFEVRELGGGTSSVTFAYRIVGRRKDIKRHRRFAKIDTRSPLPAAATRAPRRGKSKAAVLRAFIAGLEQEARERAPKAAEKRGRPPAPVKRWVPGQKARRGRAAKLVRP